MTGFRRAEEALFGRAGMACAAASAAGSPGRFATWRAGGLLAVLVTDPALRFLCTVSGVDSASVKALPELLADPVWAGIRPDVVVPADRGTRLLATHDLRSVAGDAAGVEEAEPAEFRRVLLAGYGANETVSAYIAAEHGAEPVRRFLVRANGEPIAAAALSVHDGVAVLGGASTLPGHRDHGAQSRLLTHRLTLAARAGCTLAVATAAPDSPSARNLTRAGFTLHPRHTLGGGVSGGGAG